MSENENFTTPEPKSVFDEYRELRDLWAEVEDPEMQAHLQKRMLDLIPLMGRKKKKPEEERA